MDISLQTLIEITSADDYFYVNVKRQEKTLYLGYAHETPEELQALIVEGVYLDFPSKALGIDVR